MSDHVEEITTKLGVLEANRCRTGRAAIGCANPWVVHCTNAHYLVKERNPYKIHSEEEDALETANGKALALAVQVRVSSSLPGVALGTGNLTEYACGTTGSH
jgi:hypothetical protein